MLYYCPHDLSWPDWKLDEADRTDLKTVLTQPFKVACIMAFGTEPGYPWYEPALDNVDFSQFDLVLISDIEFYRLDDIKNWINKLGIKNYRLIIGGYEFGTELDEKTLYRPWWAFNIVNSNPPLEFCVKKKKYFFDALLGQRRYNRDFVMHSMQRYRLLDKNIVTYRDGFGDYGSQCGYFEKTVTDYFRNQQILWPYISPNLLPEHEVSKTITRNISATMPYKIYNNTYYSIICESAVTPTTFFLSEKTGKVFYGHRPFVHFGHKGYLKELKKFGFETFNSVIDESYDDEPDLIKRYTSAFNRVIDLMSQDPVKVITKLQPVLEHNHNHLCNWIQQSRKQIVQLREDSLKSLVIR